ncbi:endonuclease [Elizabethkingia argentiflava]|uniref:UPF0102 protein GNY06_05525 n=1 Tax=Elizabethkingia argenteiflava TaxID=2681556 RepID=A0A845PUS8_9FLAO|nr:YraN family protein [Elizabethkingia argenteiflava]NAW50853.1 endonuclease [Elizabethkingia argenteiflava]
MAQHHDFGKHAEDHALAFLEQQNYRILAKNWHFQKAEIDIIARKANRIHIVEVKARNAKGIMLPEAAVDRKKIKLLIRAADEFVKQFKEEVEVQFDIISILAQDGILHLKHIENAFESID